MDLYLFALLLGFCGLAVMGLGGVLSHGGGHHQGGHDAGDVSLGHGHAHGGQLHAGAHHAAGGAAHHAGAGGHAHGHDAHAGHHHGDGQHHAGEGAGRAASDLILSFLSPRVIFSVLVGLGATGLVADEWLGGVLLFLVALAGGVAFEKVLVGPFWNFLFRFASRPAMTLESAVMDTATAVTGFDARGQGVVAIELDGQVVQLLATLRPEDRASGVRVRAGDALLVEEVDGARNQCVVSWTGTAAISAAGR